MGLGLGSTTSEVPLAIAMRMKAPPPMPDEKGRTTPRHSATVTAASTALPPALSRSTPIWEHVPWSAATAPLLAVRWQSSLPRAALSSAAASGALPPPMPNKLPRPARRTMAKKRATVAKATSATSFETRPPLTVRRAPCRDCVPPSRGSSVSKVEDGMPPASDCCGSTALMIEASPGLEALSSFQMPLPRRGRRCSSASKVGKEMPPSMPWVSSGSAGSEAACSTRAGERGLIALGGV